MNCELSHSPRDPWQRLLEDMVVLLGIFCVLAIMFLALTGCRSQRTSHELRHQSVSADTLVSQLYTQKDFERSQRTIDSLSHIIHRQDSLIMLRRELTDTHTTHSEQDYTVIHDSMWLTFDSLGTPSFHYRTLRERITATHDTIFRDRLVETDTRRVSMLRDSLQAYQLRVDSLQRLSLMMDSTYRARNDSLSSVSVTEKEKPRTLSEIICQTATTALIILLFVALISLISFGLFRRQ